MKPPHCPSQRHPAPEQQRGPVPWQEARQDLQARSGDALPPWQRPH
jgi:hypothetical protein